MDENKKIKTKTKNEIKPLKRASIKTLEKICEEVVNIEEGLMFGTILFRYDNLMSAMKPGKYILYRNRWQGTSYGENGGNAEKLQGIQVRFCGQRNE